MLRLKHLGIDTHQESVIYMHKNCPICASEGFEAQGRLYVTLGDKFVIASLNIISTDLIGPGEAGLSDHAWNALGASCGDEISVSHARPLMSMSHVRAKIYGHELRESQIADIIRDISAGRYSDIHISSFLTACANGNLSLKEITYLTKAMTEAGDRISWAAPMVVDKHSVGGLPGNRTTPIIVSIVAEYGMVMPKTSSRAITSPAGTADTMEVITNVDLDVPHMQRVVERERGCIVWGGAVDLSPADDILIRVERALDLDSGGQLIASILSKKLAAGSTHVLLDMPVGQTAKIRCQDHAEEITKNLISVGKELGLTVKVHISDGTQPVGRGIGPSLEARDVLAVLQNAPTAPTDLRERATTLAGKIIEFSPDVADGDGFKIAEDILSSGRAWNRFKLICEAQGGLKEVPLAPHTYIIKAKKTGKISVIDNRRLAQLARFAGAPADKTAGVDLHVRLGDHVKKGAALMTLHAAAPGELAYALESMKDNNFIIEIEEE